jgi:tetratricopeptide (TPR) repeat protein
MPGSADRNLLFGLLALQNNFIDRDALLDAFQRWVSDRSTPLDRILLDRGALSPSRHLLLAGLVAEHIKLHGDDPERSLAALSSIGSVREDLSRIADPDLYASLVHVSAARPDDDPYRTIGGASLGAPSAIGSRFRVVRPHARGGLGEVFLARDTELNRDVALKEIQDRYADDPRYRTRFEYEAEVTGGLEHPGIVPVYGLGHTADGRPFYAMRFIRGDSLKEAIGRFHQAEQHSRRDPGQSALELRELLGRFVDVCDAVAYAHSRGVLHRDLKPGNIMLGRYGETLVVDWGLAKALEGPEEESSATPEAEPRLRPSSGSAVEPTQAGSAVGTPGYMSPEQVDGRFGPLGIRSDVYCLGATLYHLLTCHAPCEAEQVGAIYQQILAGAIPRPRSLNPRLAPALEAICLKALALNPRERYESAELLKADLERWLADEPVTAWREPMALRVRRWARRNRTAVSGAAAAVLAGLIGLAAVAAVQARSNRELKTAYAKVSEALDAETKAKQEKERALAQSEDARQSAEAVLGFLQNDVLAATRPEGQEGGLGRDVTVRRAVDAAESKIAAAFRDQPTIEWVVRGVLGQTYLYLGEAPLAIRQLERAEALLRTGLGPDHRDTLTCRNDLAGAYWAAGRIAEAIALHEANLKVIESKLGTHDRLALESGNNLAVAYLAAGRPAEALALLEATLKLCESELGPDHPTTLSTRNTLAGAYRAAGRIVEAITMHAANLKRFESNFGPDHPNTLQSRNNLAWAFVKAGRPAEAIPLLEATVKQKESKLGPDHPDTLMSRNNLAVAYFNVGRTAEAIKLYEATLKQQEVKLGPGHRANLASRANLAQAYNAVGRTAEAITMHEATLKLCESNLGPDHPDTLDSRIKLAMTYLDAGRAAEAITIYEATLKQQEVKLGPDHPDTLNSRNNLAAAYQAAGQYARAETLMSTSLELTRKRFGPSDRRAVGAMAQLGLNLIQQEKWSEAESVLRECLAIRETAQPDDWSTFNTRSQLGSSLMGQQKYAEAEPLIVQGYEGMKARAAKIPARGKPRLAEAAVWVARLYEGWGKPEQAAAWKEKLGLADLPADVFVTP